MFAYLSYLLLRVLIWVFSWIPFWLLYRLADFLYYLLYYVVRYRRKVVRENIQRVFPNLSEPELVRLEKSTYRNLADVSVEGIKGLSISPEEVKKRWKITNVEVVNAPFERGLTSICAGAHYANWEWGALSASLQIKAPVVVIYKPIANPYVDAYIRRLRAGDNTEMGSAKQTGKLFAERAEAGRITVFTMLGDQSPSNLKDAHVTNFFGIPTYSLHGIAKYAHLYNYPIVLYHTKRVKRGFYEVTGHSLIENPQAHTPEEITQIYTDALADYILQNPADWLWSHKRWKKQPTLS